MEAKVTVQNEEGLHARPAGVLVKTAAKFTSNIELSFNDNTANAKSIMSLMGLGLTKGSEVTIIADGADAEAAIAEITNLFNHKFFL